MPDSSLEILGLLTAATAFALALRALSNWLRKRMAVAPQPRAPEAAPLRDPSGKYFLLAIVGFALHAGSFYFYLWGAAAGTVGLAGMMVMLAVGFCLMVAIFYSWARRGTWDESAAVSAEGDQAAD